MSARDILSGSLLIEIAGPVEQIIIAYGNGGTGGQVINIGDIAFDAVPAEQGDDNILGGGGNDVIFGEGGDDSIRGEAGLDQIDGGAGKRHDRGRRLATTPSPAARADDRIEGGAGADCCRAAPARTTVLGGAGNDTINAGQGRQCRRRRR